jgi:hypothetical protein
MNLYVYGFVLLDTASRRSMTIARHRIEILPIGGVDVAGERLDTPPATSEPALRLQHTIVETLGRRCGAVVPARFGSFMPLDELERLLSLRRLDLQAALRKVQGRVQMNLRIVAPPSAGHIRSGEPKSGTAYLSARRAALTAPPPPVAAALTETVRGFLRDERVEVDGQQGRTALFHLIDRGDARRYRASIRRVLVPEGQSLTITGPYAPYAFAPELWP